MPSIVPFFRQRSQSGKRSPFYSSINIPGEFWKEGGLAHIKPAISKELIAGAVRRLNDSLTFQLFQFSINIPGVRADALPMESGTRIPESHSVPEMACSGIITPL